MYNKYFLLTFSIIFAISFQPTIGMDQKNSPDKQPYKLIKEISRTSEIAMSENNIMAIASEEKFELFDLTNQTTIFEKKHFNYDHSMAFNHDGTRFAFAHCAKRTFNHNKYYNLPTTDIASTIKIYDTKTGRLLFDKKRPVNEKSYVAFHPMDDNFLLSYVFSGTNKTPFINTLSIHSINNPCTTFTTELYSEDRGKRSFDHRITLRCHPKKNTLSLVINNIWHTIDNCFLTEEKIFLINMLFNTNSCPKELSRYILALITTTSLANNTPETHRLHRKSDTELTEYSPNGDYIAKITNYANCGFITFYNTTSMTKISYELPLSHSRSLAFHPNNQIVALLTDRTFQYLSIDGLKEIPLPLGTLPDVSDIDYQEYPRSVVFSKDGKYAYIAYSKQLVRLTVPENVIDAKCTKPVELATQNVPLSSHFISNNTVLIGAAALGLSGIIATYLRIF